MSCMVCKSRGLPEIIWKSHNVRQTPHPLSPVTFPTILNNKCSYCSRIGHLLSGCPKKKYDNKVEKQSVNKNKNVSLVVEKSNSINNNMFDALNYDSESEDEKENKKGHISYDTLDKMRFKTRGRKWSEMMESDSDSDSDSYE